MLRLHYLGVLLYVAASHALYDSSSDVVDLTPQTFDRLVLKSDEIWLVEFYAPWCGHCKNLVPEYKKAATSLKGIVKVGAVNADDHKSLAQNYGVSGFPTIKIFSNGKHTPFQGQRTAEAFVEAALKAAKEKAFARLGKKSEDSTDKSAVVTLTDDNFKELVLESEDLWLVEFYAPWCGHCKNLEPHWAKAADRLRGKVKVGALDATVHQATSAQYDVRGYPTIKVFSRGSADEYQGGRTADDIVAFALERLADNAPPPELVQVVGDDGWRSCTDRALCVVAVLPHILDCGADCRTDYLDTLKRLADKYRRRLWGWSWAEAGAQPALEEALELGGFGYPALAVLNAKKLKFATLRGAFSEEGIDEFLRELSFGRGRTAPVRGASLPSASATDPWDGKDGQLPQEEELDLSDVDLDRDEL